MFKMLTFSQVLHSKFTFWHAIINSEKEQGEHKEKVKVKQGQEK